MRRSDHQIDPKRRYGDSEPDEHGDAATRRPGCILGAFRGHMAAGGIIRTGIAVGRRQKASGYFRSRGGGLFRGDLPPFRIPLDLLKLVGVKITRNGKAWAAFVDKTDGTLLAIVPRPEIYLAGLQ